MPDHHQLFGFKIRPLEAAGNPPPNQHIIPEAKDRTPRGNAAQDPIAVIPLLKHFLTTERPIETTSRRFRKTT